MEIEPWGKELEPNLMSELANINLILSTNQSYQSIFMLSWNSCYHAQCQYKGFYKDV